MYLALKELVCEHCILEVDDPSFRRDVKPSVLGDLV